MTDEPWVGVPSEDAPTRHHGLQAHCRTCEERVDAPDKGLGRALVATWLTNHQGHDVTTYPEGLRS